MQHFILLLVMVLATAIAEAVDYNALIYNGAVYDGADAPRLTYRNNSVRILPSCWVGTKRGIERSLLALIGQNRK